MTNRICEKFSRNPNINPRTGRSIQINGPTYKALLKECNEASVTPKPIVPSPNKLPLLPIPSPSKLPLAPIPSPNKLPLAPIPSPSKLPLLPIPSPSKLTLPPIPSPSKLPLPPRPLIPQPKIPSLSRLPSPPQPTIPSSSRLPSPPQPTIPSSSRLPSPPQTRIPSPSRLPSPPQTRIPSPSRLPSPPQPTIPSPSRLPSPPQQPISSFQQSGVSVGSPPKFIDAPINNNSSLIGNKVITSTINSIPALESVPGTLTIKKLKEGYGVAQKQQRGYEDRYKIKQIGPYRYFAVFDGHGGSKMMGSNHVADYATKNLPEIISDNLENIDLNNTDEVGQALSQSVVDLDIKMHELKLDYGSTCTFVLIDDERNLIYQVNLGDSRSILINNGVIIAATEDHKPTDQIEKNRIEAAGGAVFYGRVNGSLAVARALGDFEYKSISATDEDGRLQTITEYDPINGPVSSVPDVQVTNKDEVSNIILTSDAPFERDAFNNQSLVNLFITSSGSTLNEKATNMVQTIVPKTTDDTTIILVDV